MINIFGYCADMVHMASYIVLIRQILSNKSVNEISYRTQEIYLIVYLTRYGDILFNRHSMYLTCMKIIYVLQTIYLIYLIKFKRPYCQGYDKNTDNFNHYLFIYPAIQVVTILFHSWSKEHPFFEFSWSFSIWLESVAILPQLIVVHKKKEVEIITGQYMALLAVYRALYLLNWAWRIIMHGSVYWIKLLAGLIQTAIFADFLYYFYKSSKVGNNTIKLPV